jgi:hypothetical protein
MLKDTDPKKQSLIHDVNRSVLHFGYKIELVEENNGITYPFKIGINGVFNYGFAPSIENGFALGKEFVGTIMRFAN